MSDEVREATVNENQKLVAPEEQITKPATKVKPQKEKDPKKVAAGKRKKQTSKSSTRARNKTGNR